MVFRHGVGPSWTRLKNMECVRVTHARVCAPELAATKRQHRVGEQNHLSLPSLPSLLDGMDMQILQE